MMTFIILIVVILLTIAYVEILYKLDTCDDIDNIKYLIITVLLFIAYINIIILF